MRKRRAFARSSGEKSRPDGAFDGVQDGWEADAGRFDARDYGRLRDQRAQGLVGAEQGPQLLAYAFGFARAPGTR